MNPSLPRDGGGMLNNLPPNYLFQQLCTLSEKKMAQESCPQHHTIYGQRVV